MYDHYTIPAYDVNAILKSVLEQVTEAVVLDKEFAGEAHARVHLFTKDWGRVVAKATSARKMVSKLGPHLEPLMVTTVRLLQKNHLPQAVDALRTGKLPFSALPGLRLVKALALEYEADQALWEAVRHPERAENHARAILSILGYDPQFAACAWCGEKPHYFSLQALSFSCSACLPQAGECVSV